MTKHFCDLCGEPATFQGDRAEHCEPVNTSASLNLGPHCKVRVTAIFSFTGHQGGFSGPPDLCKECAEKLIKAITA